MSDPSSRAERVKAYLASERIATLPDLKALLGTRGTMTVFRTLKALDYLTSYSHRGKYHTLPDIARFGENGLWSCRSVWFSKYGNLLETARHFVDHADEARTAGELETLLHVEVHHALLALCRSKEIDREKVAGVYVYCSSDREKRRAQLLLRRDAVAAFRLGMGATAPESLQELKAALLLFVSLLDEKQRRLYAGLESSKLGRGGDRRIAELLDLDVHTVSRGRRELLAGEVAPNRVRAEGGGRKPLKKKRRN
jgi:hypothetical protein